MADNYLENRYGEYLERKQKKESLRKAAFRKRLEEYRKVLASASQEEHAREGQIREKRENR